MKRLLFSIVTLTAFSGISYSATISGGSSNSGTITGVTAGVGLSGGGTSGNVTVNQSTPIASSNIYANAVKISSTPYGAAPNNTVIYVDASSLFNNTSSVTLPSAVSASSSVVTIEKIDTSTNSVTIVPNGSDTIDNGFTAALLYNPSDSITLQSDGISEWKRLNYTGNAARIFNPNTISGLQGWFKADTLYPKFQEGATVTTWADQVTGSSVTLVNNGTPVMTLRVVNNLPAIYLGGSASLSTATANASMFSPSTFTIIVVCMPQGFNNVSPMIMAGLGTNTHGWGYDLILPTGLKLFRQGFTEAGVGNNATGRLLTANSLWHVFTWRNKKTATTGRYAQDFYDGFKLDYGTATPYADAFSSTGSFYIGDWPGTGNQFTGYVGEVLFFTQYISDANLYKIWQYLSEKWGIELGQ